MESIWSYSAVKVNRQISFWTWLGRIVPLAYIPASIAYFYFELEIILNVTTIIVVSISPLIAITWWWWAMDTMKWLTQLYNESIDKQLQIISELKEIRESMQTNNDRTRNR